MGTNLAATITELTPRELTRHFKLIPVIFMVVNWTVFRAFNYCGCSPESRTTLEV